MFARLYQSAKAIFTDSAGVENTQPTRNSDSPRDETMVTTRQKDTQAPADHEIGEENSINVYVPSGMSKRQRKGAKRMSSSEEDESEYVPPNLRKRKRLPMRAKDVESPDPGKTRPVVEIPAKKLSPEPDHVNSFTTDEAEAEMEDQTAESKEHDTAAAEIPEKLNHRRFAIETAEDEFFSTAREEVNDEDDTIPKSAEDSRVIQDSEDEDSDDDEPEAVDMQEAAKSVKMKENEAARAVKDQLSASRKKRKERDEALKKQAKSSKKRKLEDDLTNIPKPARRLAREYDKPLSMETDPGMVGDDNRVVENPLRLSTKRTLPDVLPAEYFEDEEPQDLLPFDQFPTKKAKKTKFHLIAEKEPKDRRVGSTTYRVTKAHSTNLAPKSSSNARNTKEQWLQGRSGKKGATSRKPFSKGFFKK